MAILPYSDNTNNSGGGGGGDATAANQQTQITGVVITNSTLTAIYNSIIDDVTGEKWLGSLVNRPKNSNLTYHTSIASTIGDLTADEQLFQAINPNLFIISRTMMVNGFAIGGLVPNSYISVCVYSNV